MSFQPIVSTGRNRKKSDSGGAPPLTLALRKQRELKASLIYRASSMTTNATQKNFVSKNKTKKK